MSASTHRPAGMARRHAAHGRVIKAAAPHGSRPAEPQDLEMFSDRLDDAQEYESIIKGFATVHDAVHAADDYGT